MKGETYEEFVKKFETKKTIFGNGFLISEKAATIAWELSEREKEIIRGLEHESR